MIYDYNRFSHCLVCGGLFYQYDALHHDDQWWKRRWFKPIYANYMDWAGLYRAICQFGFGERYRLSGISGCLLKPMGCTPLFVDKHATDRQASFNASYARFAFCREIEPNSKGTVRTCVMSPGMNLDDWTGWIPHGYIIHDNCWLLLDKLFPQAESNRDMLLEVCCERYLENDFGLNNLEVLYQGRCKQLFFPDGFLDEGRYLKEIHTRDPLNVPAAHSLVQRALQDRQRVQMKRKTKRWPRRQISDDIDDHSFFIPSVKGGLIQRLPFEVVLSVLDQLDSHAALRNVLAAFNWVLPDTYWRGRMKALISRNGTPFLFEMADAITHKENEPKASGCSIANAEFRWKTLFLGTLRLMDEDPNMRNRMRIFTLIDKIRDRFESWEQQKQQRITYLPRCQPFLGGG